MAKKKIYGNVNLGDKVRDPLTEIEGIAYSRITYLQGCDRIGIQQPVIHRKEDVPLAPELWYVDEPQLEVLKRAVVPCQEFEEPKPKPKKTNGGPSSYGRSPGGETK